MKKYLALILALALCLGLCACGGSAEDTTPTEPEAPKVEDDGVTKILLICHSLGVDSIFMFPDVCRNEGMEDMVIGFLYHSGCLVAQHVNYARQGAAQYAYYEYDMSKQDEWLRADCNGNFAPCQAGAANDIYIEDGSIAQTLEFGIKRHDWDKVILQAGSGESAGRKTSTYYKNEPGKELNDFIQELREYVLANDCEPGSVPTFSWNMVWSSPKDRSVRSDSMNLTLDTEYEGSEYIYYKAMSDTLKNAVEPAFEWEYVFPAGTTVQNLKSTKLASNEIHRDYAHVTDFGRLAVAYTWYCTLTGTAIEDCKIPPMNHKVLLDKLAYNTGKDMELTEEYRAILIEAVGNALKSPYDILPTQFAE